MPSVITRPSGFTGGWYGRPASRVMTRSRARWMGASRAGLEVVSVPGTMQAIFQFWGTWKPEQKDNPIAKPRVRQALSLAIDRKQVIEHVMNGKARMPYPFSTFAYTDFFSADR